MNLGAAAGRKNNDGQVITQYFMEGRGRAMGLAEDGTSSVCANLTMIRKH